MYYNNTASTSKVTTITVGFYAPKVGDFAYANGSFSPVCDTTQGLVGVVFYSNSSTNADGKKVHDVRVLSANYSSTDVPMSPAKYAVDYNYEVDVKSKQIKYNALLNALGLSVDLYTSDVATNREGGEPSGVIKYDTKLENTDLYNALLNNTTERIKQKEYIKRASSFLSKLKGKGGITVSELESENFDKPTVEGKQRFEQILKAVSDMTTIEVGSISYSSEDCGGFTYALYPAFLNALYYEPELNVELSGKGSTYFGVGNWYIPDGRELERIIYYRINSAIYDNALTEDHWNAIDASEKDITGKGLNVFTKDAFANIKFLGDKGTQVTSVGTVEGEALAYGLLSRNSTPTWAKDWNEYYSSDCGRDIAHNISPVCRLELIEP